jgi:hypothetical protein
MMDTLHKNYFGLNKKSNDTMTDNTEFYRQVRQGRLLLYSRPRRYYNRDGESGSAFKFLFLTYAVAFLIVMLSLSQVMAQRVTDEPPSWNDTPTGIALSSISNYTTVYHSGRVFLNWTARNEPADCIYIIERSQDGKDFTAIGVKEGIGTDIELFYSWMDESPPEGFAYYRVKKITRDGMQLYSAAHAVLNMDASYNPNTGYARRQQNNSLKEN